MMIAQMDSNRQQIFSVSQILQREKILKENMIPYLFPTLAQVMQPKIAYPNKIV